MSDFVHVPLTPGVPVDYDDVTVSDEVIPLLEENTKRSSGLVINLGPGTIRVTTDGSDPTPTHGKPVSAGNFLQLASPRCPQTEVKAIRQDDEDAVVNVSEVN